MKFSETLKLGSLIPVAILIWLAVFSLSYHTFVIDIPLELTNLTSGLAVADNPASISATVRAKNIAYYRLRTSGLTSATADLSFIQDIGNYNIKPQLTFEAHDVWLVSLTPDIVPISVVPAVSATVTVEPDIKGFPANGYALGDISLNPAQVAMIGPESIVANSPQVRLVIDVSNKQGSFTTQGRPEVRDANNCKITNIRFNPAEVSVNVTIVKGDMFKTVGLTPTFSGSLPAGYWISEVVFDPPAVTLKSSIKKLDLINDIKTTPINLIGKTGDFSDQLGLDIPTGTMLVGTNLVNVKIKIGVSSFNRKLVVVPRSSNVTPGLKVVSIEPTTVSVMLSGPSESVNTASNSNVILNLDLRTATSGDNTIKIEQSMFQLPDKVSLVSFDPPALQVNLTKTK